MGGIIATSSTSKAKGLDDSSRDILIGFDTSRSLSSSGRKKADVSFYKRAEYSEIKKMDSLGGVLPIVDRLSQAKHPDAQEICLLTLSEVFLGLLAHSLLVYCINNCAHSFVTTRNLGEYSMIETARIFSYFISRASIST